MQPRVEDVSLMIEVVRELRVGNEEDTLNLPKLHATIEVDTAETPNFQQAYSHAMPHTVYHELMAQKTLPADILELFGGQPTALVHGMVEFVERIGYYQHSKFAMASLWNRELPELPVVTFTDKVEPGKAGQSHEISDEKVREAGKEIEGFTSKVITSFFRKYAARVTPSG